MGEAAFYHLTRRAAADVLPPLLTRALAEGWRVVVRGTDAERLRALDLALWEGDGFLPHGLAGGPHDARQPVLLTTGPEVAECVMAVDGARVTPHEVEAAARVCLIFDGDDDGVLAQARGQWAALTGAGCAARYWSEESGRWQQKAARNVSG